MEQNIPAEIQVAPKVLLYTDYLAELHWLKIFDYVLKYSMFKCLHNLAPQYLINTTILTYHQEL